ncbi:MAG: hypothetical protein R3F21_18040 [Myxococcota bacterium]
MGISNQDRLRRRRPLVLMLAGWAALGWLGCQDAGKPEAKTSQPAVNPALVALLGEPLPPDATLEQALAHRDPLERARRVAEILAATPPDELDSIRATIEAAPLAWGDIEYTLFASWWARFDPSSALAYCDDELRLDHPRVVGEVLRMWGRTDPQAALDSGWLSGRSIEGTGLHAEYLDPLIVGWFESGNPGLETFIEGLDPSSRVTALGAYMRMKILRDGRRQALEWSQTAPFPPEQQRLLLASGLKTVASQDPQLAVEWLEIAREKGVDVRTFVARIARGWAHRDPRAAMDWLFVQQVADPVERLRATNDVARIWLNEHPAEVEEWLDTDSTDPWVDVVRIQAIQHHVRINDYRVDWERLLASVARIANPEQRQKQHLWALQRWKRVDPDAATFWLAGHADLLGEQIQFVDQLPQDEQKRIAKAFGTSP